MDDEIRDDLRAELDREPSLGDQVRVNDMMWVVEEAFPRVGYVLINERGDQVSISATRLKEEKLQ